ncbi:phosphatase PAP2 family protein [Streptomyces sp. NPDC001930]|uniref:phosphatase PAP2 family protein n=1 Tax=Streptomyces sp. NPDC001930 TaxID=3364625 RepID=UPI0036B7209F
MNTDVITLAHALRAPLGGASFDADAYLDAATTAQSMPGWLDSVITAYSAYGLTLFALLMAAGWWRGRHRDPRQALMALAAPALTVLAFATSSAVKALLQERRPCQAMHVITLEACPPPGDWSFPSNHATLAGAAAVTLWFVSWRLGAIATPAALAMAASRVWVGAHYPHDVVAGLLLGALISVPVARLLLGHAEHLARRLRTSRLHLLVAS